MIPSSREKISVRCTKCGRINFVRRDYLKRLTHLYWCRHCCYHWKPETLKDRIRISLVHRRYNLDELFFEKIDNEEKAYWLGFLSGDGVIIKNRIKLRLAAKDEAHLKKFKKAITWTGKDYYHKDTNAFEVYFKSFKMVDDLARYFITPRKTYTIKFPDIPKPLERHFIRGVFDADGCISKAHRITRGKAGQIYISHGGEFNIEGNKEFISAVQSRFKEVGLPFNSIDYPGKRINRIRYGGINQLNTIYKYLYENVNIFLERKKELFQDILKDYHYEIIREQNRELRINKFESVR